MVDESKEREKPAEKESFRRRWRRHGGFWSVSFPLERRAMHARLTRCPWWRMGLALQEEWNGPNNIGMDPGEGGRKEQKRNQQGWNPGCEGGWMKEKRERVGTDLEGGSEEFL